MSCWTRNSGWPSGIRIESGGKETVWQQKQSLYANAIVLRTLCIYLLCGCWQHIHSTHICLSLSLSLPPRHTRCSLNVSPFCKYMYSIFCLLLLLLLLLFFVHSSHICFFAIAAVLLSSILVVCLRVCVCVCLSAESLPIWNDVIFMDYCHLFSDMITL